MSGFFESSKDTYTQQMEALEQMGQQEEAEQLSLGLMAGEEKQGMGDYVWDFVKTLRKEREPFTVEPQTVMLPEITDLDVEQFEQAVQGMGTRYNRDMVESLEAQRDMRTSRVVDVTDTPQGELTNPKPLYDMAKEIDPGTIETKELGLMSKPKEEAATEAVTTTLTDLVYNDFVVGKQEGDDAHVGQDNKNITLAGGVVPDGLKYNGKDFTQGSSVVSGFDKTKLDTSGAYKKVGTVTVKRSDFDSDKAFAKGVIKEFANQAETAAGDNWSSMSEGSKKAVVKIGWNKGAGWYSGKSAKAIYAELAKDEPNPDNLYSKILVGSTVKGGGASLGIAKARANAWNETISATGGKEITRIDADNSGKNTAFKYYDKDGNLLHTEQTTRASSIYENKAASVSKNNKGVW